MWRDRRQGDEYAFETVYSVGNTYGDYKGAADNFNKKAQATGLGIVRRQCADCRGSQHNDKFFKRKTNPRDFNYWQYLMVTWSTSNNQFHRDFDIYNSLDEALNERNPWAYCNANDPGVGFPRDCGPTGYVPHIWNALPNSRHFGSSRKNYRYSVVQKAGPPTTTISTTTKTTNTATSSTTTTTTTTTVTSVTATTATTVVVCDAGEYRDQFGNKCVECPDGTYQPAEGHQMTRCEYAATRCKFDEHMISEPTKKSAIVCSRSTECTDEQFESKAPERGKTDRECTLLTVCEAGQYESTRPTARRDRECKECDGSYTALRKGCTTTVTTATSSTKTWTTRTKTETTKTATTKTQTTKTSSTVSTTTFIEQPDPDDIFDQKEAQTADGVSQLEQIATQLEQGTSVESLLAGGYTLDDIKDSNVGSDEITDAISSLNEKAEKISSLVIEGGGDKTMDKTILKIKRNMDRADIPRFVQINDLLYSGADATAVAAGETVSLDYLTALLDAGYTKNDFVGTEITSAQLEAATAQSAASSVNNPNNNAPNTNGPANTTNAVIIAVVVVVLLAVVLAAFVIKRNNASQDPASATSFENPFYAHNPAAEGAYMDLPAAGGGSGEPTTGYMDITPQTGGDFGNSMNAQMEQMEAEMGGFTQQPGGAEFTSGYMDVAGGAYTDVAPTPASDEEEI